MKKNTRSPFLDEIEMDLDEIMKNGVFEDKDEIPLTSMNRKNQKKLRNKSQ